MMYKSPAKRPRMLMERTIDSDQLASAIHQAVTTKQRLSLLHHFLSLLGYDSTTRHCDADPRVFEKMIEAGVVNALRLQLGFVLQRHGSSLEEVELICIALDLFFTRCPRLVSEESLRSLGSDLLRLLLKAFRRGIIQSVLSIWHSCSAGNLGTSMLLQDSGVLQSVTDVLQGDLGEDQLMEILGLLKNLTYYGEEHRQRIVEYPGIFSTLTSMHFSDANGKAQERLSAVFRNLAISPENRLLLAQHSNLLTAFVRMASCSNRQVLRNVLNALVSLAMDAEASLLLVFHGDGIIIEIMKRLVVFENDEIIRKRAARAVRLMARDTSAPVLVHDTLLMETLSHRALHDSSNEVRVEAAEAFTRCAGLIKAPMPQHDAVLDALTHLAHSPGILPEIMARALKEQASHPENRTAMAQREKLMVALAKIAIATEVSRSAKEDVFCAFLNLSAEESNRILIAKPPILEALVRNSAGRREDYKKIREFAVRSLANLALNPCNRKGMANHSSLLQSLLQFATTTSVNELKVEVKKVILQLAAEL